MEKFVPTISYVPVDHDPFASNAIVASVPTTEAQREIWTASSFSDDASCSYNESVSLNLDGVLDTKAMSNALKALVQRHESLRSLLNPEGTRMIVQEDAEAEHLLHDWRSKSDEDTKKALQELSNQLMTSAFNLFEGPVFRSDLILLKDSKSLLRLTAHHVICDGWSLGIMMADIASLYNAFKNGTQAEIAEAVPFRNYVKESIAFSKTEEAKEVKQYWLDLYQGSIPRVDLPTDRKRPKMKTYAGDRLDVEMDPAAVKKLKEVSTRNGSSLVTTLLTCFEILIHKITRQEDIVVGLPAAGQSDMDMRELVGHCVNLLPLRTTIDPNIPFVDHLKARRTAVLDAYDNQRFTFGTLLNELRVPREAGRIPLVPVVFNIDMNMDDGVAFDGLSHSFVSEPRKFENFELFLNATGSEEKLVLEWSYNIDLFDRRTIEDWMHQLNELIETVSENPQTMIRDLGAPVLRFSPNIPIKESWEGTFVPMPTDNSVYSVFRKHASAQVNNTALVLGDTTVSYAELEQRVENIFKKLQEIGVQPNNPVGVCMERSVDFMASILAVLKSGAFFVPLDPSYPQDRLSFMLEDTGLQTLITSKASSSIIKSYAGKTLVAEEIRNEHLTIGPAIEHKVDDPAYIMYTSGSSGTPKGVVVPHRAIIRLVNNQDMLPFSSELVFLQLSNTSFDASTLEIWGALLNGAKLVLQKQAKPTLQEIADTIEKNGVTTVWFTTGLFNLMVDEKLSALKILKHIFTGGDVLSVPHIRKAFETLGPGVLHNGYGPTENTTFTTTYQINNIRDIDNGVPIGEPISGTRVLILNEQGERCKLDEEGTLYAGGNGLALGYWKRKELTKERFILDPFNGTELLYNTGDLVKWSADGNIHFVGRADGQVKVRGFRIELGEIESALDDMAQVKDRVVICRTDRPGEKELVAYVVPSSSDEEGSTVIDLSDHDVLKAEVKTHLDRKLPSHMVPSAYVVLEQLPLTANGKVDKRALPQPERISNTMRAQYVAPRNNLEQIISGIWSDLLNMERVGVKDNFFEIGGHSLIGIQLFAEIKTRLQKELPLKTLFSAPTVAAQARLIMDQGWQNSWQNLTAIQPEGSRVPFFAVHADEANYFIPKTWGKDQPFYAFFHQGDDGHKIQFTEVTDIARHFIQELRQVRPHGPYLLGGYSFGGIVAYEMAQQLTAMGERVPLLAFFDTYDPVEYVKIMQKERKFYDGLKNWVYRTAASFYLKRNKPLPGKLRHFYVIDTYDKAIRNYQAKPYDGPLTVLKAKKSGGDEKMGWTNWSDQVEVKLLPGDHYSIVREPHVHDLAKALSSSIEKILKNVGIEAV